jgi:hypothetical protein
VVIRRKGGKQILGNGFEEKSIGLGALGLGEGKAGKQIPRKYKIEFKESFYCFFLEERTNFKGGSKWRLFSKKE